MPNLQLELLKVWPSINKECLRSSQKAQENQILSSSSQMSMSLKNNPKCRYAMTKKSLK